jgi:hypothetical protein
MRSSDWPTCTDRRRATRGGRGWPDGAALRAGADRRAALPCATCPIPTVMLGVARGATLAQIKAAHRALAKRYHPDAPTGDPQRFLRVQEAYQLLSDPLSRREWDARHSPGTGPRRPARCSRAAPTGPPPAASRAGPRAAGPQLHLVGERGPVVGGRRPAPPPNGWSRGRFVRGSRLVGRSRIAGRSGRSGARPAPGHRIGSSTSG